MKEIKAIFRPSKLLAVTEQLQKIPGLPGMTVSDIRGIGKGSGSSAAGKESSELIEFVSRVKLEIVVPDAMAAEVVDAIQQRSHTGNSGDGKIFVSAIDDIVKIRTNERGPQAV